MDKKRQNEAETKPPRAAEKDCDPSDNCAQIDDIIGGFGRYQLMIFLFKVLIGVTSAFNNLGVTFFAPSEFISFWCSDSVSPLQAHDLRVPVNSLNSSLANLTLSYESVRQNADASSSLLGVHLHNQTLAQNQPSHQGFSGLFADFISNNERSTRHSLHMSTDTPRGLRKQCKYLSTEDNKYHKCKSFEYNTGIWISTIIDEWDLVCDRAWFVSVTQSLYMAGFIVSYLSFGYISDRFGRWNSLLLGAIIEISSGFGCALSSSITEFMIFRFLLGIGCAGRSSSSYLMMIEWTGLRWRMHISTLGSLGWIGGYCFMPWLTLFFLHFRHMQLFVCFYELIFLIWLLFLPESPRWLLTHRHFDKAYNVLQAAAKFNGLIMNDDTNYGKSNMITSPSTGKLVLDGYSTSSQESDKSRYATDLEDSNGNQIIMMNNHHIAEPFSSKPDNDCEIKQRKSSLVPAVIAQTKEKDPPKVSCLYSGIKELCDSFASLFCGEGQAKDIRPYTRKEFDVKFKRLTDVVESKEFTKNEDKLSIVDLFNCSNLRRYTIILALAWAINSFVYYGIALGVGDIGVKNLFVAFSFAGMTELPSLAFSMIFMKIFPRKTTNIFLFSIILLLCALQVPLRYYELQWLQQMTLMLAKLFNTCSFTCILYQSMELFPTSIRQTAYSFCSLAGRIGSILAPFTKELSHMTSTFVPPIIYATLTIFQIISIKHLPETQGVDLPDTLLEAERFKGTNKEKADSDLEVAERGNMDKSK